MFWYVPGAQYLQSDWPVLSWYIPLKQALQEDFPRSFWYVPISQFRQTVAYLVLFGALYWPKPQISTKKIKVENFYKHDC